MPSIVSVSRQRNRPAGTVNGSQPPPSSLIATHLAPTNGSTIPHFDPGDFDLLLQESLGSDDDGQPNLGTDVMLNHKLICVIIKAGIDTIDLGSNDPFRHDNECYDQIQKCLEVFDLAVERTPEALFLSSKPEDLGSGAENVPLFVWFIPKLLSLLVLDRKESKRIAGIVWPVLGKILSAAKQCSNNFDLCISVSSYMEELIGGIFHQQLQTERSDNITQDSFRTLSALTSPTGRHRYLPLWLHWI